MEDSIGMGRKGRTRKGARTITLFQLVVFFLVLSLVCIFLGLFMGRMGWLLVLGSIVLPYLPFTVAVLSALACLTLTITSYACEKRSVRTADHAQKNGVTSKCKNSARGCVGFLIGFVAAMIVFNGSLVLWVLSDEKISISSFDITKDRAVQIVSDPTGSDARISHYSLPPYSIIAHYSYTTTS